MHSSISGRDKVSDIAYQDAQLEEFGYEPEMKRSFGTLDMIGFSFGIVNSWAALCSVLIVGIVSGGPPVILYGFLGVSIMALFVAHAFAELCSAYPIAGGQYSWVAIVSPPKYARQLSYFTGWFMNAGLIGLNSGNWLLCSNYFLGMAKLNNPDYEIKRWHNVVMCYVLAILTTLFNVYFTKWLARISKWNLAWNLTTFLSTSITILVCNKNKQPARFVFVEFQNQTGFDSPGMAVMIGLLQCMFSMVCYDGPSRMTEDMKNPTVDGPRAILTSVWLGGISGFAYLIICYFCIGNLEETANTPTGVPIIQIFLDSTGSRAATTIFTFMLATGFLIAEAGITAETSRGLWAFARDKGLPASQTFAKVSSKGVPTNALVLSCVLQIALNSVYFGSYQGFYTIIGFGIFCFYLSYASTLFARLLGYFSGHMVLIEGPYSLGRKSPLVYSIGLAFLLFGVVDFCFPQIAPVTTDNMNYCSAAFGVVALISLITWFWQARKQFTGPKIDVVRRSSISKIEKSTPLNPMETHNEPESSAAGETATFQPVASTDSSVKPIDMQRSSKK